MDGGIYYANWQLITFSEGLHKPNGTFKNRAAN